MEIGERRVRVRAVRVTDIVKRERVEWGWLLDKAVEMGTVPRKKTRHQRHSGAATRFFPTPLLVGGRWGEFGVSTVGKRDQFESQEVCASLKQRSKAVKFSQKGDANSGVHSMSLGPPNK